MIRTAIITAALIALPVKAATITACPAGAKAKGCSFTGDQAIQFAVDKARDGDHVLVRAGAYHPRAYRDLPYKEIIVRAFVGIEGKRLTIKGEPGAVLDGSVGLPTTGIGIKNADVEIRNLTITGFRWDVEEDDIYEGHGIFAVASRVRINGVTIAKYQKMGLTGRGPTVLEVDGLTVLDGHVGSWLYEGAYMRIANAIFRNNDSSAIAAYDDSVAHVSNIAVDRSSDDGVYADDNATIYLRNSLVVGSKPIALNALKQGRIDASNILLFGNAADVSKTGVTLDKDVLRADPKVDEAYAPLPGSPLAGKGIGPVMKR